MAHFEITTAAAFDAAHHFPHAAAGSAYQRLHGHSFIVEATVRGDCLTGNGWVADLGALDRDLKAAAQALDHGLLNDHAGLELPTLENLCLWFATALKADWPGLCRIAISRPTIRERCTLTL